MNKFSNKYTRGAVGKTAPDPKGTQGKMVFPSKETVDAVKKQYPVGTRVELVRMDDPHTEMKAGERGFVYAVDDTGTVHIKWDCGSSLGAVHGVDEVKIIPYITEKIHSQIMAVRTAGQCNMLDTTAVQRYANDHNMYNLVIFIEEHKSEYADYILGKFRGGEGDA